MSSFDHLGFTLLRVFFENPPILLRKKGTFSEEDQKKSKRKLVAEHFYGSWALKYFWWLSFKIFLVAERSRSHRFKKINIISAFVNFVRRPSVCAQASAQLAVKASIIFLSRWLSLSKSPWVKNYYVAFKNNLDSYGMT